MIVGIDLGTSFSSIARVNPTGESILLPDSRNSELFQTSSAVHIKGQKAFVGSMTEALSEQRPDLQVIRFFKRYFGEIKSIYHDDKQRGWRVEAIAALVLKKLIFDANSFDSSNVESAVITIPANFNDVQRKAVLGASKLAELPVLGLVEEPIAAALHYGITHKQHDQVILVYDMGGGTLDTTLLTLNEKGIFVLATDGINNMGGKEFDEALGEMILQQFTKALGKEMDLNSQVLLQLRRVSEMFKIQLSTPDNDSVKNMVLLGKEAMEIKLKRRDFEKSIMQYLQCSEGVLLHCLSSAHLRINDIDRVLLVGGSSITPIIERRLKEMFPDKNGQSRVVFHEPMKAVALGASMHALQLSGHAEKAGIPPEFRGVTSYSVGVRVKGINGQKDSIDPIIKKNMMLPAEAKRVYYTSSETQARIILDLVQYREDDSELVNVGMLEIGPILRPRKGYPIEVTVHCLEDGTISVIAQDPETLMSLSQEFRQNKGETSVGLTGQRSLVDSVSINVV